MPTNTLTVVIPHLTPAKDTSQKPSYLDELSNLRLRLSALTRAFYNEVSRRKNAERAFREKLQENLSLLNQVRLLNEDLDASVTADGECWGCET